MKKIVFLVFFIVPVFGAFAQPKITFETTSIDYGTVPNGSDGVRAFVFTNTGDAPLEINDVGSSCGCTIPETPKGPIAPGESAEIKVKYDTTRTGPFRKTITVTSNAAASTVILNIKGTIEPRSE